MKDLSAKSVNLSVNGVLDWGLITLYTMNMEGLGEGSLTFPLNTVSCYPRELLIFASKGRRVSNSALYIQFSALVSHSQRVFVSRLFQESNMHAKCNARGYKLSRANQKYLSVWRRF